MEDLVPLIIETGDYVSILDDFKKNKKLSMESNLKILIKYPPLLAYIDMSDLSYIENLIENNKIILRKYFTEDQINQLLFIEEEVY